MKKLFLVLLMAATLTAFSQSQPLTIYEVHTVKPMNGKRMAFEAAYKQHVDKYHKTAKINVYEILTGRWAGYYHVVSTSTFADMDKERTDATAHDADLDKNFSAYLADEMSGSYRISDSLSFRPEKQAEKYVVTVRHMKPDMQDDYRNEQKRAVIILGKLKGKFWDQLSFINYAMMWDGSDQVHVGIRNLVDGFASLERDFYGPWNDGNPTFKDEYIKAYGTLDWDKRQITMDNAFASTERYIMKMRKDLSTN